MAFVSLLLCCVQKSIFSKSRKKTYSGCRRDSFIFFVRRTFTFIHNTIMSMIEMHALNINDDEDDKKSYKALHLQRSLKLPKYSCCQKLMFFLAFKKSPFIATPFCLWDKTRPFYKRRPLYLKLLLTIGLLCFAFYSDNSSLVNKSQPTLDTSSDFCHTQSIEQSDGEIDDYLNLTGARIQVSINEDQLKRLYADASRFYRTWPETHNLSPEETSALQTKSTSKKCDGPKVCYPRDLGGWNCGHAKIACPDALAAGDALDEYEKNQLVYDAYVPYLNVTTQKIPYDAQSIDNQITLLLTRLDIASSIYIVYIVICIWIASPLVLSEAKLWTRLKLGFNGISKLNWILLILMLWYGYDYLNVFFTNPHFIFWWNSLKLNPCFLENEYTQTIISKAVTKCTEVYTLSNRFQRTLLNYDYYSRVEQTYANSYFDNNGHITWASIYQLNPQLSTIYNTKCNIEELVQYMVPNTTTTIDFNAIMIYGSLFISLFFKPIVGNFFVSFISLFEPLLIHQGYVLIPTTQMVKELKIDIGSAIDLHTNVRIFKRYQLILPLVVNFGLLLIMLIIRFIS